MTRRTELPLRRLLPVAVAVCAVAATPAASAKVHVDPNGPAGQQYALPLDSARGEAAGEQAAGTPGSSSKAPLFGQGIKPAKRTATQSGDAGRAPTGNAGNDHSVDVGRAVKASDEDSGSTVLWIGGLIAVVLLAGAGGGLLARRRLSAESHG